MRANDTRVVLLLFSRFPEVSPRGCPAIHMRLSRSCTANMSSADLEAKFCGSNPGLTVKTSCEQGRQIFTLAPRRAGDLLLKEDPFVCALEEHQRGVRCSACWKPKNRAEQQRLLRCSHCKVVSYCGKVCQRAHWKTHKPMCTRFQKRRRALEVLLLAGSLLREAPGPSEEGCVWSLSSDL